MKMEISRGKNEDFAVGTKLHEFTVPNDTLPRKEDFEAN